MTANNEHRDESETGMVDEKDRAGRPDAELAARRNRGIAAYSRIFAVPENEVPAAMAGAVGPVFAEEAFLSAGGAAWSDPALTPRDRSIIVICALAAQGVSGDRLSTHLRLAHRNGLGHGALTAMMTLLANYLGYPRASLAMESVQRVADAGLLDGPSGHDTQR
jgi:alkylhydroperoxidase/carboxymuconolactone decarboxylase family protein YurZ